DEGEQVDFGASKAFYTWNIETKKEGFPYVYCAVIALAEKDDGGFSDFLKDLWQKVGSMVEGAIGEAIGGLIGASVGRVVAEFVLWLDNSLYNSDDILGAVPLILSLSVANKSYYDWAKLTSPQGLTDTLTFTGDGSHYEVDVAYRVFTQ